MASKRGAKDNRQGEEIIMIIREEELKEKQRGKWKREQTVLTRMPLRKGSKEQ